MQHEIAHGWFGSQVFPDLMAPGGHWHEALATWSMARVAPEETDELLWSFISGLRNHKVTTPSLLETNYVEATDSNKYGRWLAAMLILDRLAGRERVEAAMERFVEEHRLGLATWHDVLDTVAVQIGTDEAAHLDVPTCPPPEGWVFAVVEPAMPVQGAGVALKRP